MREWLILLVMLVAPTAQAAGFTDDQRQQASAHESKGFEAVSAERWCEAAGEFYAAHRSVPTPAYLKNAAAAAEKAKDFALAKRLLSEMETNDPDVAAQIKALESRAHDVVVSCPPLPAADTAKPSTAAEQAAAPLWPLVVGPTLMVAGVVAGGGLTTLGVLPWFQYASANGALRAGEDGGMSRKDIVAARGDLDAAAASWTGYGRWLAIAGPALGLVTSSVGVAVLSIGLFTGAKDAAE